MQLNQEGHARLQAHLQNVLRNPCSVCGGAQWQVEDTMFELREFAGGGVAAQGAVKPVITATCNSCGHILFMSPLTTGIVQVGQQPAAAPESVVVEETSETIQ
ncbi:MAG: hypothetical protein Q8922_15645 [Bacteroidota bacterium]|nr:hypothetical protein [Bacteroidota bacterium]MDP4234810.1 hypothetical protein [Bacteroidota bacterium]MDP4244176.1 hypothetical protein [Bacteroidota bacterium]MDP4289348.1 hypothetical protein [Bacteroidota bacterium]